MPETFVLSMVTMAAMIGIVGAFAHAQSRGRIASRVRGGFGQKIRSPWGRVGRTR